MRRSLAAAALVLLLPSAASADARKDIVDIRHGRTESHAELLGWTKGGEAITRRLVCSEGGELSCWATIDRNGADTGQHTTVLWRNEGSMYDAITEDDAKGPISTTEAMHFIHAEADALDGLDPLSPGTTVDEPAQAFGTIGGEPTRIYLRTSAHPTDEQALRLHVAVEGPRGVSIDIETLGNEPWFLNWQEVIDARVSPDGGSVWFALHYSDGIMCWDDEDIALTVADRGEVRATLANAAGLRAYRTGELDEAHALFSEATVADPGYAWGWFNRGAVESVRGDLEAAATSLRSAIELDGSLAERACGDDDFMPLAMTEAGDALMACHYDEGC